jgi:hypothetical protein
MTTETANPLMMLTNKIDEAVGDLAAAVEAIDPDDLAEEARAVKADLRTHAMSILEMLELIDSKLDT